MDKSGLLRLLEKRGFSKLILSAFEKVDRADFVPDKYKRWAYQDTSLSIGYKQTISQPSTIAMMLELSKLEPGQKVFEAGFGSGYVLALLSKIVGEKGEVYGSEILEPLYNKAFLSMDDYLNVKIFHRDGKLGLIEYAPFDRILVSAACYEPPRTLLHQLKDKGIFVVPVGPELGCVLTSFKREKDSFKVLDFKPGYAFVPFI